MLNRNPNEPSLAHPELCAAIRRQGLLPVNLICATPSSGDDEAESLSIFLGCNFVPRPGELIEIQDGKRFQVATVIHKVATIGTLAEGLTLFGMVANISCVPADKNEEQTPT